MTKHEVPNPSSSELKQLFSRGDDKISIADGLVYIALGFDEDTDYAGLVRQVSRMGGISDIAKAEARLQIIENNDNRAPGYYGYLEECEKSQIRVLDVDTVVQGLNQDDRDLFFEEFERESNRLEGEQFAADNGLSDLQ